MVRADDAEENGGGGGGSTAASAAAAEEVVEGDHGGVGGTIVPDFCWAALLVC